MDFLTENAVFNCAAGGVIRCSDSGNSSVKFKGAALLTTGATVKSKIGVCSILTAAAQGTPQPCKCQLTAWSGFAPNKTSNGKPLLLQIAKNPCVVGGIISASVSGVMGSVTTGIAPFAMNIAAAEIVKPAPVQKNSASAQIQPAAVTADKKISVAAGTAAVTAGKNLAQENSQAVAQDERKNLLCPYSSGSAKCKGCAYPQAGTQVDNDAAKLFANYSKHTQDAANRDACDAHYYEIFAQYGKTHWSYQSHHIISGNQIFAPHVELVRLANFYGYDINNALNCIRLVSREDDYGQKPGGKAASAYDAMSLSKIQWHLGGHSYRFSPEESQRIRAQINFYTKQNFSGELKNYAQLVSAELDKIETALRGRAVCRNTDRQKAAFLKRMDNLSAKVRAKLAAFTEKPQRSFPYFVSKEAYAFAFDLPRTVKIVLLSRAGDDFVFEKFRAEIDGNLVFKPVAAKNLSNPKSFALDSPRSKIESVVFCENVELFILADGVSFDDINFLPSNESFVKKIGGGFKSGTEFLQNHAAEIVVWAREMRAKFQYAAPKQKIRERLAAGGFSA